MDASNIGFSMRHNRYGVNVSRQTPWVERLMKNVRHRLNLLSMSFAQRQRPPIIIAYPDLPSRRSALPLYLESTIYGNLATASYCPHHHGQGHTQGRFWRFWPHPFSIFLSQWIRHRRRIGLFMDRGGWFRRQLRYSLPKHSNVVTASA